LPIGKAELLCAPQVRLGQLSLLFHDLLYVVQKPAVDLGQLEDFLDRHAVLEGLRNMKDPLGVRDRKLPPQRFSIDALLVAITA
jgi:hypothetical protein